MVSADPIEDHTIGMEAATPRDAPPEAASMPVHVLILQHETANHPEHLGDWLTDAGAEWEVRRMHLGDEVPASTADWDALIVLGGAMGVADDEVAPWLPDTRTLLADALARTTPTLGICLGAQLLAVAAGGVVGTRRDGPEIGAYLVAKRDITDSDMLFGQLPITPDVMQFHFDEVTQLPAGAVPLLSDPRGAHQAFRIGPAAWGMQFHIETSADTIRDWIAARADPEDLLPPGLEGEELERAHGRLNHRLGEALDEAEEMMAQVWSAMIDRFVTLIRRGIPARPTGREQQPTQNLG